MRRLTASSLLVLLLAACGGDAPPTASQPPDDAQPAAASDARPGDFTAASRTFDDWRVLCDNLGGCTAYGSWCAVPPVLTPRRWSPPVCPSGTEARMRV